MKFIPVFLLVFIVLGSAAWESVGPYGGNIRPVMLSYSNDNIVYVASSTYPSAVAKSTDGGATWTTVGSISGNAYSGAIDPTNHNKVYIGCGSYFYRTTNGGTNWSSTYVANTYPYGMVVHATNPAIIYAAGYAYDGVNWRLAFIKSTDSGVSWTNTYLYDSTGYGYGVAIDRTNPNTVYVCGYSYYNSTYVPLIYKSTNGGTNWALISSSIPSTAYYINSIAVHPTNPNIVYAGAWSGIYRSTDAGATWTQTSTHYYNYGMAVSSAAPNVCYVGGYSDIYKTTDAGVTWASASTGFQGYYPYYIAMSKTSTQLAYYGDSKGIFKTTNAGSNWFDTNNNLSIGTIGSFSVAPSSASTIYTSFEGVGVYKTTNSGTNWTVLPTPVGCGNICEFAIDNTNPNIIYALEGSGWGNAELYKSTDGGSVWTTALDSYHTDGGACKIDPNNSSVIYTGGYVYDGVSTYVMTVSKSTDGGTTWHRDTLTTTYCMCYALTIDRSNSNIVYAGGYNGVLYKSTDAGSTWFLSNTGLSGSVNDIAIGSTKANTIYAGSSSGVFKSTNAGANWTNTGCTNVYAVLINPTNENEIYAATYTGVYKSTIGGGGWTVMNDGLASLNTTSLGIYANNYLFVGTNGSGMYRWNIMVGVDETKTAEVRGMLTAEPNPSAGRTRINYELVQTGHVDLAVYDIQGRLVKQLISASQAQGIHTVAWNGLDEKGSRVASGIYFCRLDTGDRQLIEKLILTR